MLFRAHTKCSVPSLRVILMGNLCKNLTSGKACIPALEHFLQVHPLPTRKMFLLNAGSLDSQASWWWSHLFYRHTIWTAKREKVPSTPSEKGFSF